MPGHFGKYNYAICRRLSRGALAKEAAKHAVDIVANATTNGNGNSNGSTKKKNKKEVVTTPVYETIDFEKANEELNNFIATLRMLNVDVIELCPDDSLAYDSVFIGDCAVTINGLTLLCRPRDRLEEIKELKQIIKSELNLPIIEIYDETALLNGGDVLWTGRQIYVGLSNETNEAGARAVAAAFPEYPVTPVKVPTRDNLRLKSYITMAGPDILCVNRVPEAHAMLRRMEREASINYRLITVDDEQGSNVQYLNGTLLHRNDKPDSVSIFQDKIDFSRVPVKISELTKNRPYSGLDSLCIMVRKSHRIQKIV